MFLFKNFAKWSHAACRHSHRHQGAAGIPLQIQWGASPREIRLRLVSWTKAEVLRRRELSRCFSSGLWLYNVWRRRPPLGCFLFKCTPSQLHLAFPLSDPHPRGKHALTHTVYYKAQATHCRPSHSFFMNWASRRVYMCVCVCDLKWPKDIFKTIINPKATILAFSETNKKIKCWP